MVLVVGGRGAWANVSGVEEQVEGDITIVSRRRPKETATASIVDGSAANVARVKQIIGEMAKSL